jgi:hypothetical protein
MIQRRSPLVIGLLAVIIILGSTGFFSLTSAQLGRDRGQAEIVKPAERDVDRWGDAVCNDGTPFAFLVSPSPSQSSDWVIHLQGGSSCDDKAQMCSERNVYLTTTLDGADGSTVNQDNLAIFSRDAETNPTFSEANQVQAHYCSSDLWSGSTNELHPTSADPDGWYFAGRINVRAMIEILIEQYGLDDSNPDLKVMFSGSSAGGAGVVVNADTVAELLPQTAADDRLLLVNDAGFVPEFPNEDEQAGEAVYNFWGSQLNSLCEQAHEASEESLSTCIRGPVSYPFLAGEPLEGLGLPYLVQQSTLDTATLTRLGIRPRRPADQRRMEQVREATLAAFEGVAWVFSGGEEPYHTLMPRNEWTYGPDGDSFRDFLTRFWEGGEPEQVIFGNP